MEEGKLLQLIACGAQDVYLNGNDSNHQVKFRIYYKKYMISDIIVGFEIYKMEFIKFVKKPKYLSEFDIFDRNLHSVDCQNIGITKLPIFKSIDSFRKLKHLNCSKNKLTNINKLMYNYNLIWLDCSINKLKSIPKKIFSIEYWDFSNNQVDGDIDFISYTKLKYLLASGNQITSVSNLQSDLIYLDLSDNPLIKLENLPFGLRYLLIVKTKLKKINLIELENLQYLDISINNFNSCIDGLPSNLIYLNCSQCEIIKLDNLPFSLKKLVCVNNQIKSLDMLPLCLEYLDCDHNQIINLNNLPNNLKELVCSNNEITELNNLPQNLIKLNCDYNQIINFNNLPNNLTEFKYNKIIENNKINENNVKITFFKVTYKRYTNFSFETIDDKKN
jgi:Leucine-rich repeat (LRR) protein